MQRHYLDADVFIRSMATRGSRGGVATALRWAVQVLDAAGKEVVLVETVGVGQTEVDVTTVADTVVVVLVPEAGDTIQTMKAGLSEIGDIFVVNKADREGAYRVVMALKETLYLGKQEGGWQVPVVTTQAHLGEGTADLYTQILEHRKFLESSSQLEMRRRKRRRQAFLLSVEEAFRTRLNRLIEEHDELAQLVERGEMEPLTAARKLIDSGALSAVPPPQVQQ